MNPILQNLNQSQGNMFQMLNNFKQFVKGGITPQKAKSIVEQKLNSGEISQTQLNSALQKAQSFIQFLK